MYDRTNGLLSKYRWTSSILLCIIVPLATMDPTYPLFPVFAFMSFCAVLIPLPWHLEALNSGTCLFMIWTAVACLNQFINSIVWSGNVVDWAPLWCDISTRLMVGISVAIPAASLCINRRLYKIATCHTANITYAHKRRAVLVDLSIGLGIPALQMALQFVVQGHRYDIWEDIGCLPTTVNTPPAYPLSFLWPIAISLVSATYCILTLKAFMSKRAQFGQILSSNSSLTVNRYFRLMCLATSEIVFTIPLSSYGIYLNIVATPIYHWKSWSDTHFDWYTIDVYPSRIWRSSHLFVAILEFNRWSVVFCAVVFFAFFGFADEAQKNYRRFYWAIARRLRAVRPSDKPLPLHKINPISTKGPRTGSASNLSAASTKRDSIDSTSSTDYTETIYPDTPTIKVDLFKPHSMAGSARMSSLTI